jgi:hypothetical protein
MPLSGNQHRQADNHGGAAPSARGAPGTRAATKTRFAHGTPSAAPARTRARRPGATTPFAIFDGRGLATCGSKHFRRPLPNHRLATGPRRRRGRREFPALCRRRGAHRRRSMIRTEPRPPLHHGSRIGVVTHRAGALADGFASAWRQANDRLSKLVDRELQAGVDQSVRQKVPGRGVARPPARPAGSPSWTRRMA